MMAIEFTAERRVAADNDFKFAILIPTFYI